MDDKKDQDEMSEFSIMSGESEIGPQQNVMDLRIARIELNENALNN